MKRAYIIIACCAAVALAAAFIPIPGTSAEPLANPSDDLLAVYDPDSLSHQTIQYEGFTVTFSPRHHQPAFVAWEIDAEKAVAEVADRKDSNFRPDDNVDGCPTLADYRRSGYDRGHMAPAADMKWSKQAMDDCHYLTNICPQHSALNGGPWATVEKNTRRWTQRFGQLYIIAGPILNDILSETIGDSGVTIPNRFFKVIIAPYADTPMGIAFLMPNRQFEGGAQATVTSIDNIEAITGYDFFAALPDDIEEYVEQQHTLAPWNH